MRGSPCPCWEAPASTQFERVEDTGPSSEVGRKENSFRARTESESMSIKQTIDGHDEHQKPYVVPNGAGTTR